MTPNQDPPRGTVEGPVAETGDVRMSGTYVAGHDIVFAAPKPDPEPAPFLLVDREYLEEQARKPKQVYVARSPDWADVVHGTDPDLRFIERDRTAALLDAVRADLLAPVARGTDRQLHSLFVLGAPGSGKTTLARRVAAVLALAGECVIADFGVKTERVTADDIAAHTRALDALAAAGTPVLVLLDDPFFANSGWVELLHALGRPQHQGIAVLGASPDFLFRRYAHWLFGKQVLGATFDLGRPSAAEREHLALLHHRDPAASSTTDEDLLVVAMEAAAGQSFRDIMQRIWMTLNGGVAIDPAADVRTLPWPVLAFAVICHFHRNYVLCPEPLLREFLAGALDGVPPAYLAQELQQLVTQEGWRIFSVRDTGGVRLVGSTHARVAREAWQHRPLRGLDVEKAVIDVSPRAPVAVPQLAELILANRPQQTTQLARRYAARWSTALDDGTARTPALCALVRALKPSRQARHNFRTVLRKCLNAEDRHSWLAAWQLYHLSSRELHPQERDFLIRISLPWTLKVGDLAAGPAESIEIAERMGGDVRRVVVDRLTQALRGELDWTADAQQVSWLLAGLPGADVLPLLEPVYAWLDNDLLADDLRDDAPAGERRPSAAPIVRALVGVLGTGGLLDEERGARLLGAVFDWLLAAPELPADVVVALADIAVDDGGPRGQVVLTQLFDVLCSHQDGAQRAWAAVLGALRRSPDLAEELLPRTLEWVAEGEVVDEGAWRALLGGLGGFPEQADAILCQAGELLSEHPGSTGTAWAALLGALGRAPQATARDVLLRAFAWLRDRPGVDDDAWSALLAALGRGPGLADLAAEVLPQALDRLRESPADNDAVWTALLTTVSCVPGLADLAREVLPPVAERLLARPDHGAPLWGPLLLALARVPGLTGAAREVLPKVVAQAHEGPASTEATWSALLGVLGKDPALTDLAEEILPRAADWLLERPGTHDAVWVALYGALGRDVGLVSAARDVVPRTLDWLLARPESNEAAWSALLGALGRNPALADLAREVVPRAVAWLRARPEPNELAWRALLSTLGRSAELAPLARVTLPLAYDWLRARPENNESAWSALLRALGRIPGMTDIARRMLPESFAWLRDRPENNESAWSALLRTLGRHPGFADLAQEILPQAFTWLDERPENNETAWSALLSTLGRASRTADLARELLPPAFARLRKRPEPNESVWSALLSLLGRMPQLADLALEIVPQAFERLMSRHENNESAWRVLHNTVRRVPGLAEVARDILPRAFEWLRSLREDNESAWNVLLSMVMSDPESARELVLQTYQWVRDKPEGHDSAWAALLFALGRVPGLADLAREIVPEVHARLRDRLDYNQHVWSALLGTLGRVPELTDLAVAIVPEAYRGLRERPEQNLYIWSALLGTLGRVPELAWLAREVVPDMYVRLARVADNNEVAWPALLGAFRRIPDLADLAPGILLPSLARLCARPEHNETTWSALMGALSSLPHLAPQIMPPILDWLSTHPERDRTLGALLQVLSRTPELAEQARAVAPLAFGWLRERPGLNEFGWAGLLALLSSPVDVPAGLRAEMLAALDEWHAERTPDGGNAVRAVQLLRLAEGAAPGPVAAAEAELSYLEGDPERPALLALTRAVEHVIAVTGSDDLAARYADWRQNFAHSGPFAVSDPDVVGDLDVADGLDVTGGLGLDEVGLDDDAAELGDAGDFGEGDRAGA